MANKVFITSEIGQAHNGDIDVLHQYIDAVSETGVDAIKFQMHIAEAESSPFEPFRVKINSQDKTRYDYWKRMEFSKEQWIGIKKHCEDVGLEFMCSPFSNAAVDILEEIGIQRYKIGSGEVTNFLMLEKIAGTGKEIILSSGMSSFEELEATVDFIKQFGNKVTILQCTTKYPTPAEDIGLNVIGELKERFGVSVGLSDHSGEIYPSIAAVVLGATFLEVHVVLDKNVEGPDTTSSVTVRELKQLVEGVRYIERAVYSKVDKTINKEYMDVKSIFEKSLSVNQELKQGDVITEDVLEGKKPSGQGIPAKDFKKIVGSKLKVSKNRYEFLKEEDLVK